MKNRSKGKHAPPTAATLLATMHDLISHCVKQEPNNLVYRRLDELCCKIAEAQLREQLEASVKMIRRASGGK